MTEFFQMGGFATYVWGSYAATALGLIGILAATLREHRARRRELARIETAAGANAADPAEG